MLLRGGSYDINEKLAFVYNSVSFEKAECPPDDPVYSICFLYFPAMCTSNFRVLPNVTPKSFSSVTMFVNGASDLFPIDYRLHFALLFPTCITFAICGWNGSCYCLLHLTIVFRFLGPLVASSSLLSNQLFHRFLCHLRT